MNESKHHLVTLCVFRGGVFKLNPQLVSEKEMLLSRMDRDKPNAADAATTVAQILNLLYRGFAPRRTADRKKAPGSLPRRADSKSAIQQSATLRYDRGTKPQIGFLPPLRELSSLYYGFETGISFIRRVNRLFFVTSWHPCPSVSIRG
jgi:hypothetical protein